MEPATAQISIRDGESAEKDLRQILEARPGSRRLRVNLHGPRAQWACGPPSMRQTLVGLPWGAEQCVHDLVDDFRRTAESPNLADIFATRPSGALTYGRHMIL